MSYHTSARHGPGVGVNQAFGIAWADYWEDGEQRLLTW